MDDGRPSTFVQPPPPFVQPRPAALTCAKQDRPGTPGVSSKPPRPVRGDRARHAVAP